MKRFDGRQKKRQILGTHYLFSRRWFSFLFLWIISSEIAKTGNVEIYLKWFRREKGVEKSRDIIQIEYTNGLAEKYAEKNKEKREKLCEIEAKLKVRLVDIIFSSSEIQIAQVRN